MPGIAVAHRESTTPDGVLVQEAAAGSGVSYGALYDRYAEQIYNYCLRLTGSPDDAADATQEAFTAVLRRLHDDDRPVLEFSSYLFAAARNESYALMKRRARVQPSDTVPEDSGRTADVETEPERAALLHDSQDAVRKANATLPPRHREVLALRELGDHSYDEIGRIMGISENGAAQLIWRARSKLREAMTAGAVASVVPASADCERAQVLLSRIQDGETVDELERFWLDQHLDQCGSCRSAKGMLLEVAAFYCAWVPVACAAALKTETMTAAGGLIGADWSGVGAGSSAGGAGSGAGGAGAGGVGAGGVGAGGAVAGVVTLAAVGIALSAVLQNDPQLERNVTPVEKPAVTASEPKAKKKPAPPKAARAPVAVAAATRKPLPALDAPGASPADPPGLAKPEQGQATPKPPGAERPLRETPVPLDTPEPRQGPPDTPTPQKSPDPGPPPPDDTTPPPPPEGCTWPGVGSGLGGCPPGHGGDPPGHGGDPPGLGGTPPGRVGK